MTNNFTAASVVTPIANTIYRQISKLGPTVIHGQINTSNYVRPTKAFVEGEPAWQFASNVNLPTLPTRPGRGDISDFCFIGELMTKRGRGAEVPDLVPADDGQNDGDCAVYFWSIASHPQIELVNRVKVGGSENMRQRSQKLQADSLQVGSIFYQFRPVDYTTRSWERAIHRVLAQYHVPNMGGEVFDIPYLVMHDLFLQQTEAQMARYLVVAATAEARQLYSTIHQFVIEGKTLTEAQHRIITVSQETQCQ